MTQLSSVRHRHMDPARKPGKYCQATCAVCYVAAMATLQGNKPLMEKLLGKGRPWWPFGAELERAWRRMRRKAKR